MKWHLSHRNQPFENGQKAQGQTSTLVELNWGQADTRLPALETLAVMSYKHSLQVQTVAMSSQDRTHYKPAFALSLQNGTKVHKNLL